MASSLKKLVNRRAVLGCTAILFTTTVLPGCSSYRKLRNYIKKHPTKTIRFVSDANLNKDYPVAIDIVFVKDTELTKSILAMNAHDWFKNRTQLRHDNPDKVSIQSLEIVPGRNVPLIELTKSERKAHAIIVFGNFMTSGSHRLKLLEVNVDVELGGNGFIMAPPS